MSTLSRDSMQLSNAIFKEASRVLRRKTTNLTVEDAFRNALVDQARQSNLVANNILAMQQQFGLIRYHGLMGYWQQRQSALTANNSTGGTNAATASPFNFSTSTTASNATTGSSSISGGGGKQGNVAQVAFMITGAMRKEMSDNLGYTAEQIKGLTPVEASLILHHQVSPNEKEEKLPGLVQAYEEEQDRIAKEEKERQEQQRIKDEAEAFQKAKEAQETEALATATTTTAPAQPNEATTEPDTKPNMDHQRTKKSASFDLSSQEEPNEGLYKLEDPSVAAYKSGTPSSTAQQAEASPVTSADDYANVDSKAPLGSFVKTMEEQTDRKKEWYEVIETRRDDNSQTPVGLFSTLEEAEMALELKQLFSDRRAKEDESNKENIPAATYTLQKTIK